MQQDLLSDMLTKRKNRAIAIVLGVKERETDGMLTPQASDKLRKVVLDQFNDYGSFVEDLLLSLSGTSGVVVNELFLEKLDQLHEIVVEIASRD